MMTRRTMLAKLAVGGTALAGGALTWRFGSQPFSPEEALPPDDDAFLDAVERDSFQLFWQCAHPRTGLVLDRGRRAIRQVNHVSSIAATGFGLASLCVADHHGWLPPGQALERARLTLRFLAEDMPHQHGFFYHFVDWRTGSRALQSEVSSIDTAILLCGILTCKQHFHDDEIRQLATQVYERIDWRWMLHGGPCLSHGWKPEGGFLKVRWDSYSEHMMLYLLAIGAKQHAIPAESWHCWTRPEIEYAGIRYVDVEAPLFIHQYSHAWFNFRDRADQHVDYFENSVRATKAHQLFCQDLSGEFPHYGDDLWGITASDSPFGYVVWGGPPRQGPLDGTIVPCAAGGSLPFAPRECLGVLRRVRERFGGHVYNEFGFVDAFNPATGWVAREPVAINTGITLLMAENSRTGFVWDTFMRNEEAQSAMDQVGFRST